MALFKKVNGKSVKLSAQEESSIRAEWAANDLLSNAEEETRLKSELIEDARNIALDKLIKKEVDLINSMDKDQMLSLAKKRSF